MFKVLSNFFSNLFVPSPTHIRLSMQGLVAIKNVTRSQIPKDSDRHSVLFSDEQGRQIIPTIEAELQALFKNIEWNRKPVHFVVAADLVRYFMVSPLKNTMQLQDCIDAAKLRFHALFGEEDLNAWQIEAHWSMDQPFLACAIPNKLTVALQNISSLSNITIDGIVPEFIDAWNHHYYNLSDKKWLLVATGDTALLGMIGQLGLVAVRTIAPTKHELNSSSWCQAVIQREAFNFDLPLPEKLILCGELSPAWANSLQIPVEMSQLGHRQTGRPSVTSLLLQQRA